MGNNFSMAADAAAAATAEALEHELKEEENRLGNLPEECEADLADWPQTPNSLHEAAAATAVVAVRQGEGVAKGEAHGEGETAALMSPPLSEGAGAGVANNRDAHCPASAANLAAILKPGDRCKSKAQDGNLQGTVRHHGH